MKKTLIGIACSTLLLTSFVFAQGPHTPPDPATMVQRHVAHLTTLLSLTTAQQTQATTILTNAATANSGLSANMKTAHQSLSDAVKKDDLATIDSAATTLGGLSGQRIGTDAKAQAAIYAILTPDQQTKLTALESQGGWHQGMGMMGGGPGQRF